MDSFFSIQPLMAVLVSLAAFGLIILFRNRPNLREAVTVIAAVSKLAVVLSMLPDVLGGRYPEITLVNLSPDIGLALRADEAGIIFAMLASMLWVVTSFYSFGYMRGLSAQRQTRFYASFALCLSATIGLAFSANLLTFFLFYEVLTVATYPLVAHKGNPEALAAGRKYLAYLITGGVVLLGAIAYTYQVAGTLDFNAGGFLPQDTAVSSLAILFALFLIGFGFKSAVMPLHSWLPSAMVAPTPVSALLHAVAVVKAGVFGLVRAVGFVLGPEQLHQAGALPFMLAAAAVTIVVASLLAMRQDNLKARLAYSTIGHLSYIVLGLALFDAMGWTGSMMHIVNHGAMKITMFFCAGAIYVRTHFANISQLDGIGHKMPWTMAAFTVAALGLAGVPPVSGFISKWFLVQGTLNLEEFALAGVFLVSGLLNAGYFFPIVYRAFFKKPGTKLVTGEAPLIMLLPIIITAGLSLFFGLFPDAVFGFYELAERVGQSVTGGGW